MEAAKPKMIYRYLGNSGLKVSVLSYGNWLTAHDPKEEEAIVNCIKSAYENGINFFDTAEIYGFGIAETIMGKALKATGAKRSELVVSTKILKAGQGPNDTLQSRKHIVEGLKNSLKRLDLAYVDVVFAHRPDYETPLEETCRAYSWLIDQGLAFYWGTSEWTGERIADAIQTCERLNLHKPICDQCQYSMLVRDKFEREFKPLYEKWKYGTTIWSPLAGGILSGKYNDGVAPEGSRYEANKFAADNIWPRYFGESSKDETVKKLKAIADLAKEQGCSQAQLALAWTIVNGDLSTCIFGATKVSQVEDNIKAIEVAQNWTRELDEKIEKILDNQPKMEMEFRGWKDRPQRRGVALDIGMKKP